MKLCETISANWDDPIARSKDEPTFSYEEIERLKLAFDGALNGANRIAELYLTRKYRSALAIEHARHGLVRRVATMRQCMLNVFDLIPPENDRIPERDTLHSATINIQSFILNAFGAIDNLAWIWVSEADVRDKGKPLSPLRVGIKPKHTEVRSSFTAGFQDELACLDRWFEYLVSYRDALAHRIPLYIPPYVITSEHSKEYDELELRAAIAISDGDLIEHERLHEEMKQFATFRPWMKHAYSDPLHPVAFHPQMTTDIFIVAQIATGIIRELNALPEA